MISIHKNKNNQWDFGISAAISYLSLEEMNKLRAMVMVAIGTAEEMFSIGQQMDTKESE